VGCFHIFIPATTYYSEYICPPLIIKTHIYHNKSSTAKKYIQFVFREVPVIITFYNRISLPLFKIHLFYQEVYTPILKPTRFYIPQAPVSCQKNGQL
jgi:hypothetical protein